MNREVALTPGSHPLSARLAQAGLPPRAMDLPSAPRLDAAALLRIVRVWKWLILSLVGTGVAGALVLTMLTEPQYRATVTLQVNPPAVEVLDEQSRERQAQVGSNWDMIATQVGLLGSRSVAERAAQDLGLAARAELVGLDGPVADRLKAATDLVAGGLKVDAPEEGQIIRFSYTAAAPGLAAEVANGVAEAFINTGLQRRFEASAYARRFLEQQIARTRVDLEQSERRLVDYAQREGIITLGAGSLPDGRTGDGASLQGESLAALNQALAQATAQRVAAEGAYRSARMSGPTAEVNSSTQALRQAKAGLEADYQDKLTLMKPEHPDMLSLRGRIDELGRQIARETAQVAGGRANSLAQAYRAALSAERALQSRVSALKGSVLDLRGRSVRYNILQREVDTNRGLYDALLQRYKEIGVAGGVSAAPVSIVDRAELPRAPFTPNLPLNLLFGVGLGAVLGLVAAVGADVLHDSIRTRDDVRQKLGLACLGQIPKCPAEGGLVEKLKEPQSDVSEAYSAVAAALRFTTDGGAPRLFLITSTQPEEGKSSSALALAQNWARRGHRVLLVDADLRQPSFKAAREEMGLTSLLTTEQPVRDHVSATQFDNLFLLPSGPLPPNPADLLATPRFGEILEECGNEFQTVIVDAPPVLGLADAPLLAAACGHVLFVVEAGKTRTRAAVDALHRLEATGAHLLGAVLTKAAPDERSYGYERYRYGTLTRQEGDQILMIPRRADG